MKDTLREIQEQFGNSKAIFACKLSQDNQTIEFECLEPYDVKTADVDHNDCIVKLMVENYRENFYKDELYKAQDHSESVCRTMFGKIKQAFVHASSLKNPQQSKLYKWLEFDRMMSLSQREGLIALYRYVYSNVDDNCRFKGGSENPHAKNLVAILEKMKEKHERQSR